MRHICALLIMWVAVIVPSHAQAITMHAGTSGGLMQQPTSNYYHAVYGGYLQVSTDNESLLLKASHSERPEFNANGFSDKETFSMGFLGSHFSKEKDRGLYAFIGGGETYGYIKSEEAEGEIQQIRAFKMNGPAFSMEYLFRIGPLDLAINHMLFVGYGGEVEFESNVAWPYNITQLQIGANW
jgi:hypothetical protein